MKARKTIYSYTVKITDEPIEIKGVLYTQTARVSLRDKNKNLLERKKFAVVDVQDIYQKIFLGESIDIEQCFITNFSMEDYREKYKLLEHEQVTILNFNATNSFFEADDFVDFSAVQFEGEKTSFSNVHFGTGGLSFFKSNFNTRLVDFSNASFADGNNTFKYANFNARKVTFENANFINGNLNFVNATFADGDVWFKNVSFGNGNVSFRFATFGNGVVNFERTNYNSNLVDFSKVDFGTGKLDFRRANFKNSEVLFEETTLKNSKFVLRRAKFGNQLISFKDSDFTGSNIILNESGFGVGQISFYGVKANLISLKSTILSSYVDCRVTNCHTIDLSNAIIHNILDFKKGLTPVKIERLYIYNVRNLGKLFIKWDENDVPTIIGKQAKTTYKHKAEQYRILKEDFHTMGQYEDEDKAYIEFKRNELKAKLSEAKSYPLGHRISFYLEYFFQTVVFDWMGKYATSPLRVLGSIFTIYGVFSLLYVLLPMLQVGNISCLPENIPFIEKLMDAFYFSAVTFLTIGYGDCVPEGFFKILAPLEGWIGVFMMSYFTVAFVRKILR